MIPTDQHIATKPLVSIVIPVYNGAKYLPSAIDSALGQTYEPIELLVIDDGSTDASPEILAAYGSRLVTTRQNNSGVAEARNTGIRACQGDLIAFLDQDDWWLPEKVEKQVALFRRDTCLGLVHTGVLQYSEKASGFGDPVYPTERSSRLRGRCFDQLLLGNAVFNSSVMIRRNVLTVAGMFDTAIAGNTVQDYDLWLRIARHSPFGYIPEQLTVLRLHDEQGTSNRQAMLGDELRLLERIHGTEGLRASLPMRARVAQLLDELGVAHLDAGQPQEARPCFARALQMRWSSRAALLYVASFLPLWGIDWLRRQRSRWLRRDIPSQRERTLGRERVPVGISPSNHEMQA